MNKKSLLTACLMVKNEIGQVERTIKSLRNSVNNMVVLDTGSTDGTQEFVKKLAQRYNIQLKIYEESFIDFSTSRNRLLDLARPEGHFLLMMDANDELINGKQLRKILLKNMEDDVFTIKYVLENDGGIKGKRIVHIKIGIINANNQNIYYVMPVHEMITVDSSKYGKYVKNQELERSNIYIYQDRLKDKPSTYRFEKDTYILLKYLDEHPKDTRVLYYLGQTYYNLENLEKAFHFYNKRVISQDKKIYNEEAFISYLNCVDLLLAMNLKDKSGALPHIENVVRNYIKDALEYTKLRVKRTEPYYIMAQYLKEIGKFEEAHQWTTEACNVEKPENKESLILYENVYDMERWRLYLYLSNKLDRKEGKLYGKALERYKEENKLLNEKTDYMEPINSIDPNNPQQLEQLKQINFVKKVKMEELPKEAQESIKNFLHLYRFKTPTYL